MNSQLFVDQLGQISYTSVFNPYCDLCSNHDYSESPIIRRRNLQRYLDVAINDSFESIWLGRDCGYRGGRRTGIALTDEMHLGALKDHFGIAGIAKATVYGPIKERTATEVWKMIDEMKVKVFLWNIFPFHLFEANNPKSNRRHLAREFNGCRDILFCLLEWQQPKMIVTLGADAHNAVRRMGFKVSPVRHPSYGGYLEFARAIRTLYGARE